MIARVVIAVALAFVVAGAAPASAATALLPDLGMAKLSTVTLDTTTMPGHRLLRYTAVMVNIGAGRLEVRGSRPDTFSQMTVRQRIYNTGGGHTDRVTSIAMQYAGDGHDHWHSLDMEGGTLAHVDSGGTVSALAKHGFCFFDNVKFRLTLRGAGHGSLRAGQQLRVRQPGCAERDDGPVGRLGRPVLGLDELPVDRHHRPAERQVPSNRERESGAPGQGDQLHQQLGVGEDPDHRHVRDRVEVRPGGLGG